MNVKYISLIVLSVLLVSTSTTIIVAQISVGVKKGDWIEYQIKLTGSPPQDHDVVWAKMDVTSVQGESINLDIETEFSNGTMFPTMTSLNLEIGVLGDDFIIPANLDIGDTFHDQYQGIITISDTEKIPVAGAERLTLLASTNQTNYHWDRQTGILVEAYSAYPEYTMATKTAATNIWSPQILGVDSVIFYSIIAIIILAVVAILVWNRKRTKKT